MRLSHFHDHIGPASDFLVFSQAERSDLAGTMTLDAVLLQDSRNLVRICDGGILFRRTRTPNQTTDRSCLRNADLISCEQFVDGCLQIFTGRCRTCPTSHRELIINPTSIPYYPLSIEQKDFGSSNCLQVVDNFLVQVFQDRQRQRIRPGECGNFSQRILAICIQAEKCDSTIRIYVSQFLQFDCVLLGERAFSS